MTDRHGLLQTQYNSRARTMRISDRPRVAFVLKHDSAGQCLSVAEIRDIERQTVQIAWDAVRREGAGGLDGAEPPGLARENGARLFSHRQSQPEGIEPKAEMPFKEHVERPTHDIGALRSLPDSRTLSTNDQRTA